MPNHSNEKPVRIVPNEKIINFSKKISVGIEGALNFILNPDDNISLSTFEPFLMPMNAFISAHKKKSVLIKIFAEQAFSGEIYWFFDLKTAIALGSQMRQMPGSAIDEKLKEETFDALDQDSFGEVGNQLSGILDRIFRDMTSRKIHLRMDFNKKAYLDEAIDIKGFQDKEEYAVLLANIKLPKYGEQKITLLLPRSLYETMLGLEIKLANINPKIVALHTSNTEFLEKASTELNTRRSKLLVLNSTDDLFILPEDPQICCVCMDMQNISFPLSINDTIFYKRIAANRTLQRKNFILTYDNSSEENVKILHGLGIKGASTMKVNSEFLNWALTHIKAAENVETK